MALSTAQEIINMALRTNGVIAAGETPSTDESNDCFEILNAIINNWNDSLKKSLAGSYASTVYTFNALQTFATLSTPTSLPLAWTRALMLNLAVEVAPQFGREAPASVVALAGAAKTAIVTLPTPII